MLDSLKAVASRLTDPARVARRSRIREERYARAQAGVMVMEGVCTHLGCSPQLKPAAAKAEMGAIGPAGSTARATARSSTSPAESSRGAGAAQPAGAAVRVSDTTILIGDDKRRGVENGSRWRRCGTGSIRDALGRSEWRKHAAEYYAPKNFNFWYYFGSLAMLVLGSRSSPGSSSRCTTSRTPISRSARSSTSCATSGRLDHPLHPFHRRLAFFIVVYLHMFRGLLYGSYKRRASWSGSSAC
jgi:hypothetical protein